MSLTLGMLVYLLGPALGEGPPAVSGPAAPLVRALADDKALDGLDLGASVRCTRDGAEWAGHRADVRMNPASGAKLLSTSAALALLSPAHTFTTRVHGKLEGDVAKDVVLVAAGDPSLTLDDLGRLADLVVAAGVKRVDGDVVLDAGVFAGSSTPPAFDTKNTDAGYRPEVPGFAIGSAVFIATVSPAKKAGDPVRVTTSLVAPSLVVENDAKTVAGKAIDKLVVEARAGENGRTRLVVSGTLGVAAPPQGVKKRLADPARIAGELFVKALGKRDVAVSGELVVRAATTEGVPELARLTSDPLASDVREINTTSNNFMAETVFKHLGAEGEPTAPSGPATWERAVVRTTQALTALGLDPSGFRIVNGSGLYDGTKVSAATMTRLLASEAGEGEAAHAFRDSLAVAGTSGTLKGRLAKLKGKVIGKTGTLDNAVSLSGYVPTKACDLVAFSVLVNGDIGGRAPAVNKRIDAFVLALSGL